MEIPKYEKIYEEDLKTKESEEVKNGNRSEREAIYNSSLAPYILLAVLRVLLTLVPQTGYIQPDEYFQSIEIVNGKSHQKYLL